MHGLVVVPAPVNPAGQEHVKDPTVFMHVAGGSMQLSVFAVHSSISASTFTVTNRNVFLMSLQDWAKTSLLIALHESLHHIQNGIFE